MDWSQIITGVLPLLGVAVGGFATYQTQNQTLNKQLKREIEKEKLEKNIEKLKLYSLILKLDGENQIQEPIDGYYFEFNLREYQDNIRPVLFSHFYILDQNVAEKIRYMDRIIEECTFNESIEEEQHEQLVNIYNTVISYVEDHINNYKISIT